MSYKDRKATELVSKCGNFKVEVYYDEDSTSPILDWDMGCCYIFEYSDSHNLHRGCDWEELFSDNRHSLDEALQSLVSDYVDKKHVMEYMKKDWSDSSQRFRYDRGSHEWVVEYYHKKYDTGEYMWFEQNSYPASDLKYGCYIDELVELLEHDDLIAILDKYGKDIFVKEWSSSGYCQGDYVSGVAWCTKEMLEKRSGRNEKAFKTWQEQAEAIMDGELKCIEHWLWGDVFGYQLYKKLKLHISYPELPEREDEDREEWEEDDSCWGFYEDPDEVAKECFEEHGIEF